MQNYTDSHNSLNSATESSERHPSFLSRMHNDIEHFGISLISEVRSALHAAPGYALEMIRNGAYPSSMTYRKLTNTPKVTLRELEKLNPEWEFRPGFDPERWVIVFLHGYIDNTGADRVAYKLASLGYPVYVVRYPFLRSVRQLGQDLEETLEQIGKHEPGKSLVPIGHSLGGFIWDELLLNNDEIVQKYDMPLYIPLGSPHFGTMAAHIGPGKSCRHMELQSTLVDEHLSKHFPDKLDLYPFVSRYDLLVLPIETALLKRGINYVLSETGHVAQIIRNEIVLAIDEILSTPHDTLVDRAYSRSFYPSTLLAILDKLPKSLKKKIGVERQLKYVLGDGSESPPEFRLRILHHEMNRNTFPQLVRPQT